MQEESKHFPQLKGVKLSVCSRRLPLISCCQSARGGAAWYSGLSFFSLSINNKEEQHATTSWERSYDVFVSRHRRYCVRHLHFCLAAADAVWPGTLFWRVCRHQRSHYCGGCPAEQGRAGVGIAPVRGHPGYPGGGGCPGLARHHSARFPLPAGGLGDHYWHYGDCGTARVPYELWALCVDGAGRSGLDRLRYSYRRPTFVRAACCSLVDRRLRDCVWSHIRRGLLRITLPVS